MTDAVDRTKDDIRLLDQAIQRLEGLLPTTVVMQQASGARLGAGSKMGYELTPTADIEKMTTGQAAVLATIGSVVRIDRRLRRGQRCLDIRQRIEQAPQAFGLLLQVADAGPGGAQAALPAAQIILEAA